MEGWREFYLLYPFDDLHRYHRPAALVASSFMSKNPADYRRQAIEWLQPKPLVPNFGDVDMRTLNAFGVVPPAHFMKARTD